MGRGTAQLWSHTAAMVITVDRSAVQTDVSACSYPKNLYGRQLAAEQGRHSASERVKAPDRPVTTGWRQRACHRRAAAVKFCVDQANVNVKNTRYLIGYDIKSLFLLST